MTTENRSNETAGLTVDVLVIGWGKGGKTFAGAMAGAGKQVAIVEQSPEMYGGTCINIACVPTKTLVHSASQRREEDDPQSYFESAVERRDSLIATLNDVNLHMLADRDTVTVVDGRARFTGTHEVQVTPSAGGAGRAEHLTISAETIVVNTGATTLVPDIPGADGPRVHTFTSLQHVTPFPRRLAVVGAGPVGLEFASMFRGFGAEVTLLDRGERILPGEDADVANAVHDVLTGDGITIRNGVSVQALDDGPDGVALRLGAMDGGGSGDSPGGSVEHSAGGAPLVADAVLFATGRGPATEDLGLADAGILTDDHGAIVVDDRLRTSVEGVFAVGDVHGGAQQTYLSLDDHRVVLDAVTGDGIRRTSDRVAVPATTFLTPPFASVGLTEDQARADGYSVQVAFAEVAGIKAMPRPKIVGDPRGIIKVVVDAETDRVLGARLFHVDSQDVINVLALAMRAGVTASELRDGIWIHPSSTEALNEVLGKLA